MISTWRFPRIRALISALSCLALVNTTFAPVHAQGPAPEQVSPPAAPAFNKQKLEQLAAPVALYPDSLLTQVLMAATYPLDVVQAARWRRSNSRLKGAALEQALQHQPWDPSVKSITAFPDVLRMMDEKLEWTEELGEAFLAQEQDLLQAVQDLRLRAEQAGHLKSTKQQRVVRSDNYVVIEPVDPEVIYVPIYEPAIYGVWLYPDYPPYYWYPRRHVSDGLLWFGAAVVIGSALWASWDWNRRRIAVDPRRYSRFNRVTQPITTWQHDPSRRRGVAYRAPVLVDKFKSAQPPRLQPADRRDRSRLRSLTPQPAPGVKSLPGIKPVAPKAAIVPVPSRTAPVVKAPVPTIAKSAQPTLKKRAPVVTPRSTLQTRPAIQRRAGPRPAIRSAPAAPRRAVAPRPRPPQAKAVPKKQPN